MEPKFLQICCSHSQEACQPGGVFLNGALVERLGAHHDCATFETTYEPRRCAFFLVLRASLLKRETIAPLSCYNLAGSIAYEVELACIGLPDYWHWHTRRLGRETHSRKSPRVADGYCRQLILSGGIKGAKLDFYWTTDVWCRQFCGVTGD